MSLWKWTAVGARLYTGFNLATRKRYLKSLSDAQQFAESPDSIKKHMCASENHLWTIGKTIYGHGEIQGTTQMLNNTLH